MPVLDVMLMRALTTGRLPRWWLLLPLVALWANVHGGWVTTVVVLVLASAGRAVDRGVADRPARGALGLAPLSLLAGMVTPLGPSTVMSVWAIGSAAGSVAEWAPTRPTAPVAWPLTLLVVLLVTRLGAGSDQAAPLGGPGGPRAAGAVPGGLPQRRGRGAGARPTGGGGAGLMVVP